MKNNIKLILQLFFFGFIVGIFIGLLVNIIISYIIGGGKFLPVMPQLQEHFSREIDAFLFENLLFGLIGVVFAEGTFIFKIEKWCFLKQCCVHFLITSVFYTPFIYICYMPKNIIGTLTMLGNLCFTYALTWFLRYLDDRKSIKMLNIKIEEARRNDGYKNQQSHKKV